MTPAYECRGPDGAPAVMRMTRPDRRSASLLAMVIGFLLVLAVLLVIGVTVL